MRNAALCCCSTAIAVCGCKETVATERSIKAPPPPQMASGRAGPSPTLTRTVLPGATATPKAEYTGVRAFKLEKASAEVLGVCKATEEDVQCWDSRGKKDAGLTKRVRERLTSGTIAVQALVPVKVGRKNRLLVTKISSPSGPVDHKINFAQITVGDKPVVQSSLWFGEASGQDQIHGLSVEKEAKQVYQWFTLSEHVRGAGEVEAKEGAKLRFAGGIFTLSRIDKMPDIPVCTISFEPTSWKPGSSINLDIQLLNERGQTITHVDPTGKAFTAQEYAKSREQYREKMAADPEENMTTPSFRKVNVEKASISGRGRFRFQTNVHPRSIHRIVLLGRRIKYVRLGPVPLDPK